MRETKEEESEVREGHRVSQKARSRKPATPQATESRELGCKSYSGGVRRAVSGDPSEPEGKAVSVGYHF